MRGFRNTILASVAVLALSLSTSFGSVQFRLTPTGTTLDTDTISVGTSNYQFDIRMDSSGYPIMSVLFDFSAVDQTSTPVTLTFGSPDVMPLDNPFVQQDIMGVGFWYQQDGRDYSAFSDRAVVTYNLDTSSLSVGTYTISATGLTITSTAGVNDDVANPGSLTLNVVAVPEPGTYALLSLGLIPVLARLRRR